jgi:hypothetical protein
MLRYVAGTITMGLVLGDQRTVTIEEEGRVIELDKETVLVGHSDADWATDQNDRTSTRGYVIFFCGSVVAWGSRKDDDVAVSSVNSEYVAMCHLLIKMLGLANTLTEASLQPSVPLQLYSDSQGAIKNAQCPDKTFSSVRHVDLKCHFVTRSVAQGKVQLRFVPSGENRSDIFTKILSGPVHERLRALLGLMLLEQFLKGLQRDQKEGKK